MFRTRASSAILVVLAVGSSRSLRAQSSDPHCPATLVSFAATAVPLTVAGVLRTSEFRSDGGDKIVVPLVAAGVVVGPTAGYWCSGRPNRALPGFVFRSTLVGVAAALGPWDDLAFILLAVPVMAVSVVIDIKNAGSGLSRSQSLQLTPYVDPVQRGVGLAVQAIWR